MISIRQLSSNPVEHKLSLPKNRSKKYDHALLTLIFWGTLNTHTAIQAFCVHIYCHEKKRTFPILTFVTKEIKPVQMFLESHLIISNIQCLCIMENPKNCSSRSSLNKESSTGFYIKFFHMWKTVILEK